MENRNTNQEINAATIVDMAFGFWRSRVLLTAYELGIFSCLEDGGQSSCEVAKSAGTGHKATDRLMNALCAMGLLVKDHDIFSNTTFASRFLVKGNPEFISGLGHSVHLWDTWSTLTEAVRQEKSVKYQDQAFKDRGEEWFAPFIEAMHWRGVRNAPRVIRLLDLSGVKRVIDIGGGSGCYAMEFTRVKQDIKATVFDLPNVTKLTKSYIESAGLSDKVETVAGDYNTDDLGSGFDLAFMSAIIHSNSHEENKNLIKKSVRALNPGGRLVIQDFIMSEDRTSPMNGALFALNMLVATERGDTYTESEIKSWMEEAGLCDIHRIETDSDTALITGKKSQLSSLW